MNKLPTEWQQVKLSAIAQKIQDGNYGADYPKADEFQSEGIPFLTSRAIESTKINRKSIDHISKEKHALLKKAHIKTNDVLWTNRGAKVGSTAIVPAELDDSNIGPQLTLIRADPICLDHYFLYCYLQSKLFQKQVEGKTSGSAMGFFGITETGNFDIILPPLEEQRKIAAILSTWDEAIGLVEQLIAALGRRKQALMQLLLTGAVRFAGFEGEWEEVELGDVVTHISRSEKVEADKEYKLIGVRWYLEGAHIHEVRTGSEIVTPVLSRIEKDDILYNKMWVTKAAFGVAKETHDGAYGSSEYPQFLAKPDSLNTTYLEYAFHLQKFQHEATALCRGTTGRARLNPSDFLQIKIRLPDVAEQTNIADLLQLITQEIDTYQQYFNELQEQKRGLMQQLLTGQVRV